MNWPLFEFGALLDGGTRNGIYKPKQYHGTGAKMVNMGELFAYPRLRSVEMRRVQLTDDELSKSSLQAGDLLFARRSLVAEGAGKCSIVCEVNEPTTFESSIIRARPNSAIADSSFLYYFFSSPLGKYSLGTILRQMAVSGITGTDLVRLQIPVPPLTEQRSIAHILGTLDDKIELNLRMNETLEALARSIFKSWFVDFDPVRAKMEGRQPAGMDAETAALFPGEFEDLALGQIPKGWKADSILEFADLLSGGTPQTSIAEYWDGSIPWISAKDVSNVGGLFLLNTEKTISETGLLNSSTKLLPRNTTVVTARGTVGAYCLLDHEMTMNQTNYGLKAKNGIGDYFVFFSLATLVEQLKQHAYGTIFDTITTKTFRDARAIQPPGILIDCFEGQVAPLMEAIRGNSHQSCTLAALRDTLLPKLLSGEVRVKEAMQRIDIG